MLSGAARSELVKRFCGTLSSKDPLEDGVLSALEPDYYHETRSAVEDFIGQMEEALYQAIANGTL